VDAQGNVIVAHNVAGIVAISSTGSFEWNYPHMGDYGWPTPTVGPDGTVYFAGDHDGDDVAQACTALRSNGTVKWMRADIGHAGWFAGMAISADGSKVYTARAGGKLYALDAQTGDTLWSNTVAANGDEFGGSPVLAGNDTIYLMGTDGTVYAANAANGSFLSSYQVNSGAFYWGPPSPALGPDGTLYVLAPGYPTAFGNLPARLYAFGAPSAPAVTLNPTKLTFATQVIGTTSRGQKVTLTNTGTVTLTITSIAPSAGFVQTNTCGHSVAAGGSCTITVYFKPTASGVLNGAITVTDNAAGSPHTVALTGTATVVSLSAAKLDFGTVAVGSSSSPSPLTVTNKGATALTITTIAIAGANPTDFVRSRTCPIAPATLAAGSSCTMNVSFRPTAKGARQAFLALVDDGGGSPQKVLLTGTGN